MSDTPAISQPSQSVVINNKKVDVWPSTQKLKRCLQAEPRIQITRFNDPVKINKNLAKAMLSLEENDSEFLVKLMRGGCGTKLDNIDQWGIPEADLIHARAISYFINGLGFDQAVVDQCWGNIYRKGDYCMPHSHIRARMALVYVVDAGDNNPDSPLDGRFYISDPRIEAACDMQEHCLTRYIMPEMSAGAMISFPGPIVHGVNPYNGERPRITLSWNINRMAIPGKPPELR